MTMTVTTENHADRTAVLIVRGRLSAVNVEGLRSALVSAVERGRVRIALELSGVDFIDSSGLGGIISGLKTARQAGGDLLLVAPGEQVKMLLQLTHLDQILSVYPTVEAAVAEHAV